MTEISPIGKLLFIILPLVFAGISNMIFVKLTVLNNLKVPMDKGKVMADGHRIFGDNKTWKGFIGMIVATSFWVGIWAVLINSFTWAANLALFNFTVAEGFFYGALWGLAYVLAELPNSFMKRRIKIGPGKKAEGLTGVFFTCLDQADSVMGIVIVMCLINGLNVYDAFVIVILATVVHLLVNVLLYFVKLKKDI